MEKIKRKHLLIGWICMVLLAIGSLVLLQYHTFAEYNELKAFKAAESLISETEKIIASNDADRENLHDYLKKSYLEKARTVSFILDARPEIAYHQDKLRELAEQVGVDQIHIFDTEGKVIRSTDSQYLDLTLDSGEQIAFFQPMLQDKTLEMSQDMTPNTQEGRVMLYSMCWNKRGTQMVQVGAYGERFPRILNRNRIVMYLDLVPNDPSLDILLTDAGDNMVVAATDESLLGKDLEDLGIEVPENLSEEITESITGFPGNPIYCSAKAHKDYHIYIAQYKNQVDENIPITLFTFTEYLVLVFIAMTFVVDYYYDRFMEEKNHAMKDKLTDLNSRRAYEIMLSQLEEDGFDENLVFVAMDVNGLKHINDTQGHQAGDTLLKGAAQCMRECFDSVGRVYRFGGDEFAAIILAKSVEMEPFKEHLQELCSRWSRENNMEMSISIGFSISADHPEASLQTLVSIADQQMYADKARFYSEKNHDRRGAFDENQQV